MHTDFLLLNYTDMDFLINRSQFTSSLFLEKEINIKSPLAYFNSVTFFRRQCLLIFDFDSYLRGMFRCRCRHTAKLVLITDTGSFAADNRHVVSRLNLRGKRFSLSNCYMAIKVSSQAEIVSLSLKELKLIPASLRRQQNNIGILGVRFPGNTGIQYFIDSEQVIVNSILNRDRSQSIFKPFPHSKKQHKTRITGLCEGPHTPRSNGDQIGR